MYYFVSDEHYGHDNIREYAKRPFPDCATMDAEIIFRNNQVVTPQDVTVHAGDFTMSSKKGVAESYIKQLNGNHIFLRGSHDGWLDRHRPFQYYYRKRIEGQLVVVCHYAFRTWEESHYGSWNLHGHSHNKLEPIGLQLDVGVDGHNFYPWSFDEVKEYMEGRKKWISIQRASAENTQSQNE